MTPDEMIKVLTHYRDGGIIQVKNRSTDKWIDLQEPNFMDMNFRAKPEPLVLWAEIMKDGKHIQSSLTEFYPTNGGTIKKFVEEIS